MATGFAAVEANGVAWHGFMRWINSGLVQQGIDRQQVRASLGHDNDAMTELYNYALDRLAL